MFGTTEIILSHEKRKIKFRTAVEERTEKVKHRFRNRNRFPEIKTVKSTTGLRPVGIDRSSAAIYYRLSIVVDSFFSTRQIRLKITNTFVSLISKVNKSDK